MKLISSNAFLKHHHPGHPENPDRIRKALKKFSFEEAKDGEVHLSKVHSSRYISRVKDALKQTGRDVAFLDAGETYVVKDTYKTACLAAGAAVQAAEYARNKKPAFALVRPPGHHAHPDWTNGFCIFNNVAIAAAYLTERKEKVLIVDMDMHRGDGTMEFVQRSDKEMENRLFYFSINQRGVFPGMTFDEGNVKNIYLASGTSEQEYISVLRKELPSIISSFKPSIVAISAGFDSFATDKKSHGECIGCGLSLTRKTVNELKRIIGKLPYFAVLEGGYNPDSVVEGVGAFLGKGVQTTAAAETPAKDRSAKKKPSKESIQKRPSAKETKQKKPAAKAGGAGITNVKGVNTKKAKGKKK